MNEDGYKFVDFKRYCKQCKYRKQVENEKPCNECLEEPVNLYSHKPVKFEKMERIMK